MTKLNTLFVLCLSTLCFGAFAQDATPLSGTKPLAVSGDLSAQMVEGIDRFLLREIEQSTDRRATFWQRDVSSREAYGKSIAPNRERFRKLIGAVDVRLPVGALEYVASTAEPSLVAETDLYTVHAVRWPVFEGVFGEGLLLQPKGQPLARVIALPDADQTPEMIVGLAPGVTAENQFARRLAENGCQVLAMTLIDRKDTWSGSERIKRFTNLPHREWIYRQAFELGRHVIGYEVQKVLAAVDWFEAEQSKVQGPKSKVGVAGYAEGGLVALYSAAVDPRIDVALVSGYFDNRDRLWSEPIYRNIFNLLGEFGDAEIASLVMPRALVIEHSDTPRIDGPPKPQPGRSGAASGKWQTPEFNTADYEVTRLRELVKPFASQMRFLHGNEGNPVGPCGDRAVLELLTRLGLAVKELNPPGSTPTDRRGVQFSAAERQKRQVAQLVEHTQRLLRDSERHRDASFW